MKIHAIIDFMHIYYKYYFQYTSGKLKRLSVNALIDGASINDKDVTLIYHPLKDIEYIRKELEKVGHEVVISVCFDRPSLRKELDAEGSKDYKAGRPNNLTYVDFNNIDIIKSLLDKAGHNTYRIDGYEADDIINYLVKNYANQFDYNIIYTNDKDLLINVNNNVGVMRFKQYKGYTQCDKTNYTEYLEEEYKVFIPYNALGLFLSSAGDSADRIKGIMKFGPKAFGKLITKVSEKYNVDWSKCGDYDELAKVIPLCADFLTPEQFEQLQDSFKLVSSLDIKEDIQQPTGGCNRDRRIAAYGEFEFKSLFD